MPSEAFSPAASPVLACIGTGPGADLVVRAAARLAGLSASPWHAVLVETPRLRRLPEDARRRVLERLDLARELGASTSVLEAEDPALALAEFARVHGCKTVVLGRTRNGLRAWTTSVLRRVAASAPDVDLIEIALPRQAQTPDQPAPQAPFAPSWRYRLAVGVGLFGTVAAWPLLGPASGVALLLLVSLLAALGWLTIARTGSLREQARMAGEREARTRALYEFARELQGVLLAEQVEDITRRFVQRTFNAESTILVPGPGRLLRYPERAAVRVPPVSVLDMATAQWAYENSAPAGAGTARLGTSKFVYLPLIAPMRTRGVLLAWTSERSWVLVPEQRELLDAFAALAAIALERVHYVEVAQDAEVRMEGERLRNSLLSALSHDLRTPLTSLVGLSEALALSRPELAPSQLELAAALRDEAKRMSTLVANLLDMARIESGKITLNLEWQSVEEAIGSALRANRWNLAGRAASTRLAPDLPLVRFDAMLIERVLCNLLENACKYTPADARIEIGAIARDGKLELSVRDDGPGLPPGREEDLFEKFARGGRESAIP
ncbi:MAG TPA: histidine kinase dimerization/phospho-acceptor domain-containing protein, partial [Telluria sp.]|nr:histidine kinase dimerization/phospho-acceptor domain-containing protein [Telluria sp.]